jgi:hypothetical protein
VRSRRDIAKERAPIRIVVAMIAGAVKRAALIFHTMKREVETLLSLPYTDENAWAAAQGRRDGCSPV